ncbi:MAG: hypothetical protein WC767_03935, partial [Candidatus Paceibacterota bacterium]
MAQLFNDEFKKVETDEEFEELKVNNPAYDAGYLCQLVWSSRDRTREWLERLWKLYAPYDDTHFLADFK